MTLLRVLHVAAPARTGGLETVLQQLAVGLRGRGHDVHVALVLPPGLATEHPMIGAFVRHGVPVHPIAVGGRAYRAERRAIGALLRKMSIQVLHTHGYRSDVIDGSLAKSVGGAHVTTLHGFVGNTWRGRVYEWLQVRAAVRAQAAIAVSAPIAARLRAAGAQGNVHVLPNASAPFELLDRNSARSTLGIPAEATAIGWIGRLSEEKRPALFIQALAHTPPTMMGVIVGDGPLRVEVERLAKDVGVHDRVHFVGLVPAASRYLPAFDALTLTSRTEGTPMVLLEAMRAGVPIVATAVGGVPDLVGESALLCPSGDAVAIARGVQRVTEDPALREHLLRASRERVETTYSVERWLDAHEQLYQALSRHVATTWRS